MHRMSAQLNFLGYGRYCQVCGADGTGDCSSDDDNGESMECKRSDEDACVYYKVHNASKSFNVTCDNISLMIFVAHEVTKRDCAYAPLGDECINIDHDGIVGYVCYCTTDNCNKDNQCDCSSSTQAPTTQAPTTTSSRLKCQVCDMYGDGTGACSNDDDNGESMECEEGADVCEYFTGTFNSSKMFNDSR